MWYIVSSPFCLFGSSHIQQIVSGQISICGNFCLVYSLVSVLYVQHRAFSGATALGLVSLYRAVSRCPDCATVWNAGPCCRCQLSSEPQLRAAWRIPTCTASATPLLPPRYSPSLAPDYFYVCIVPAVTPHVLKCRVVSIALCASVGSQQGSG